MDAVVTDADMQDPELLAELAAITGAPLPRAKPSEISRPTPARDPAALKDRITSKKREALMLKKSGDAQAAVAALREAKEMEAALQAAEAAPTMMPSATVSYTHLTLPTKA